MDQEASIVSVIIELTGLPQLRARTLVTKVLFANGIALDAAVAADVIPILPTIAVRLGVYMDIPEVTRRVDAMRAFLETGKLPARMPSSERIPLSAMVRRLRASNDHQSQVEVDVAALEEKLRKRS